MVLVPWEVSVVPQMSVAENVCLNVEPARWGFIDVGLRLAKARAALRDFGLDVDPLPEMGSLDLATQQLVVIARALWNLKLLILDEPTAALTEKGVLRLFDQIQALKARGVYNIRFSPAFRRSFLFRTASLSWMGAFEAITSPVKSLALASSPRCWAMLGRDAEPLCARGRDAALEVRRPVFDESAERRVKVDSLSMSVAKGEVVGLFGLLGAGCVEAALAIYGRLARRRGRGDRDRAWRAGFHRQPATGD